MTPWHIANLHPSRPIATIRAGRQNPQQKPENHINERNSLKGIGLRLTFRDACVSAAGNSAPLRCVAIRGPNYAKQTQSQTPK